MLLSQALEGLKLAKGSEGKSPHTLQVYQYGVEKLIRFTGDQDISAITRADIERFFNELHRSSLSEASIANVWRGIRVLYKWAEQELDAPRPEKNLPRPQPPDKQIIPYSESECRAMINACDKTSISSSGYVMHRPTADRDRAIIFTFLDTGLRVSELARLRIKHLDLVAGEIHVEPFRSGIKSRGRSVYVSDSAKSALWKYLARHKHQETDYLFTSGKHPMNRDSLNKLIRRLGKRADVRNANPHRFRHTFSIQYLRNGGDIYTLQKLLGHSSWKMCRKYLDIAQTDVENAHRKASPVDNWGL